MSFRALILMKNREAKYHKANSKKAHFKFKDGIYVISESKISNSQINEKIKGAEAIYFEGNPNPIGFKEMDDSSSEYLNEMVMINALKQTGSAPRFNFGKWLSYLAPLKDPVNLIYLLFGAVIVYGLIAGGLGWV